MTGETLVEERRPRQVVADDGWVLRGEIIPASGPDRPRAIAVVTHAMMADRRSMDRPRGHGLASTLAQHGIEVHLMDLRGHGESGPTARDGGSYVYDDFVRHDIPSLIDAARLSSPGLPVTLVGHSLGGHAALAAAGLDPARAPDRLVALAANMWVFHTEPVAWRRLFKAMTVAAWSAVALVGGRFDPGWIGVGGDAEPWPYIAQFARILWRDRWSSRDGAIDYEIAARRAELSILSVSSAGDRLIAHPEVVRRFMSMAERSTVQHRVIEHGELDGTAPGHMGVVTEPRCRPIWGEIAEFIVAPERP